MKKTLILILSILIIGCIIEKGSNNKAEYLRWVGDIEHDPSKDNRGFAICNGEDKVLQYFNLMDEPIYIGEKPALLRTFENKFRPVSSKKQNGLIRIRFIVNCKGQRDSQPVDYYYYLVFKIIDGRITEILP